MGPAAASSAVRTDSPDRVAREVGSAASRVSSPAGAIVFVSGALVGRLAELADELCAARLEIPLLVVGGAGVLSERGELERQSAASTLVWGGDRAQAVAVRGSTADDATEQLARTIRDATSNTASPVAVFIRPDGISPDSLAPLHQACAAECVFGAGTVGDHDLFALDEAGTIASGAAAAMILSGLSRPIINASPACRLLTPLRPITRTDGPLVLEIGGEKALELLNSIGHELGEQQLLLAMLASDEAESDEDPPPLIVRGIRGVDPVRGALLISSEVRPGMRLALATRDAAAARADLQRAARQTQRAVAGAAPRFGLYISCAGRGSSLYGSPDVDTRILRSAFADLPFAGLHSSFEIVSVSGKPTLQLYSGVLALFTSPS